MPSTEAPPTSQGLLLRASAGDKSAQEKFVSTYRFLIIYWFRSWGLQEADSEDAASDLFLYAIQSPDRFFQANGPFRARLRTSVANRAKNFLRDRARRPQVSGGVTGFAGNEPEARTGTAEWECADLLALVHGAAEIVRAAVGPESLAWRLFERADLNGEALQHVAKEFGVPYSTAYRHRASVRHDILEILQR